MAMRLQEVHPALVHFPITLLPVALAADALGRFTNNRGLMEVGRRTMPLAAASAAISGIFGLIAQESVKTDAHSDAILTTHRNLNLGLIGLTALMAAQRSRRRRPSLGYLLLGAAGAGVMSYSAYLGGHMVYEHGVGVGKADGLLEDLAPEVVPGNLAEAAHVSAEHLRKGIAHTAEYLQRGEIAPYLTGRDPGGPAHRAGEEHGATATTGA